jgi:phage terminase large subunit-like protein
MDPTDSLPKADYVTEYAQAVTDGTIIAGPHVRAACKRHLDDLIEAPQRGFFFDYGKASRVIEFFQEVLHLNGGAFEGLPFDPSPWQKFILGSLFGWVDAGTGYRRFQTAYIEVAKGNGKSPLLGGIGLYMLMADGEPRAEIYAAAAKKDQAMILFRDAVAMATLSPALSSRLIKSGRGEQVWNLAYPETASFFRPISSDKSQSGPRPHAALLDEIHEHRDSNVVDMMVLGTKGRRQPLIAQITNSGYDKQSVCWKNHDYGTKVASGALQDDSFFAYIASLDEGDQPFDDESCWIKANPNLGVSIQPDYIRKQVVQAKGMPSKESIVLRLNFCEWVGADAPWLSADAWLSNRDNHTAESLAGRRCYGGLDLSSTQDLTALVLLFEPDFDDPYWRLLPYFWLPADGLEEKAKRDGADYPTWIRQGWLETTPGAAIDHMFVLHRIAEIMQEFDLAVIGNDRYRVEYLKNMAINEGLDLPLAEFGQGYVSMAPAVDEFERRLLAKQLKHNGNPVMTWCAANTVVISDPAGNRKPAKNKSTGRIDGTVAAMMSVGQTLTYEQAGNIDDFLNDPVVLSA